MENVVEGGGVGDGRGELVCAGVDGRGFEGGGGGE